MATREESRRWSIRTIAYCYSSIRSQLQMISALGTPGNNDNWRAVAAYYAEVARTAHKAALHARRQMRDMDTTLDYICAKTTLQRGCRICGKNFRRGDYYRMFDNPYEDDPFGYIHDRCEKDK